MLEQATLITFIAGSIFGTVVGFSIAWYFAVYSPSARRFKEMQEEFKRDKKRIREEMDQMDRRMIH